MTRDDERSFHRVSTNRRIPMSATQQFAYSVTSRLVSDYTRGHAAVRTDATSRTRTRFHTTDILCNVNLSRPQNICPYSIKALVHTAAQNSKSSSLRLVLDISSVRLYLSHEHHHDLNVIIFVAVEPCALLFHRDIRDVTVSPEFPTFQYSKRDTRRYSCKNFLMEKSSLEK